MFPGLQLLSRAEEIAGGFVSFFINCLKDRRSLILTNHPHKININIQNVTREGGYGKNKTRAN